MNSDGVHVSSSCYFKERETGRERGRKKRIKMYNEREREREREIEIKFAFVTELVIQAF